MQVLKTKKGKQVFLNRTQTSSADIASYKWYKGACLTISYFFCNAKTLPHRKAAKFSYRILIKTVQRITLYVRKD